MLQIKISLIFNVYKTLTILYSLISWGKYMCLLIAVELFTIFIKITSQRYSSVSGLQLHKALRLILKCVVNTAVVICCEITLRLTLPGPNYFDINNHTTESLCSKFGFTSLWKIKCIVLWITRMNSRHLWIRDLTSMIFCCRTYSKVTKGAGTAGKTKLDKERHKWVIREMVRDSQSSYFHHFSTFKCQFKKFAFSLSSIKSLLKFDLFLPVSII